MNDRHIWTLEQRIEALEQENEDLKQECINAYRDIKMLERELAEAYSQEEGW